MSDPIQHLPEGAKYTMDALSATAMLGALFRYLPEMAALLTIIWTGLRVFDWIEARLAKHRNKPAD